MESPNRHRLPTGFLTAAALTLLVLVTTGASNAPERPLRQASAVNLVRDLEPGRARFDVAMTPPEPVGGRSVAWIQSSYSPYSGVPFLWAFGGHPATASLLKEVRAVYDPTWFPQPLLRLGDRLFFSGYDNATRPDCSYPVEPYYLWSTDGTPAGTSPVRRPTGEGFEYASGLSLINGSLYFFAASGSADLRLWRSDGTPGGTVTIGDVRGIPPSFVGFEGCTAVGVQQGPVTVIGGVSLFFALSDRDPTKPYGLYRLNETGWHTTLLQDFESPGKLVEMGGIGYFEGTSTGIRAGLWRTDGTPQGTRVLRDSCLGSCGIYPDSLTPAGNLLFFSFSDGIHGSELWKSDGTEAGTVMVKDIRPGPTGSVPFWYFPSQGQVFFLADDGEHGRELWRSDGTPEGTRLLGDLLPGPESSGPTGLVAFGPWVLFSADDGGGGRELWRTDGTAAGTVRVMDIAPGTASSNPRWMTSFGGVVYFSADDSVHGRELWRTDGTPGGTRLAADLLPGPEGSDPFLTANPGSSPSILAVDPTGLSLLALTGPAPDLVRVTTLQPGTRGISSRPELLTDVAGTLCFFTNPTPTRPDLSQLWRSNGSEAGTLPVATIRPYRKPVAAASSLYFSGETEDGTAFWRFSVSPGTLETLTKEYTTETAVLEDTVYVVVNFSELWRATGNSGGLSLFKRIDPGISQLTPSAGKLFFVVGSSPRTLWRSDGTEAGTFPVFSGYRSGLIDVGPSGLTDVDGSLFFNVVDYPAQKFSLWRIPPLSSSATLVRTFSVGPSALYDFPSMDSAGSGGLFYFLLRDIVSLELQLWRSDGTDAGTYRLSEVAAQRGTLRSGGGKAFFVAVNEEHGRELWTSDGTPQGTRLVKDINPDFSDSNPLSIAVIDGIALFSADDGLHGAELWQSDGTQAGTYLLDDVCPGPCSSFPGNFVKSGGRIFFAATDDETGRELWSISTPELRGAPGRRFPSSRIPRD